jgi:alpha-amylase/alpha-mannosidase (GH57 family)
MPHEHTLKIALMWHMHQPYYYDPEIKKFKMPWVRLHSTKDYLDMLLLTEKFPSIKPIFNFTPSLLLQIEMYLNGVPELHLELTLKDPKELTPLEKNIILKDFFMANWDTMIKPFPRYYELLTQRGRDVDQGVLNEAQRFFTRQDFIDLQVLFNLAWVDPIFRRSDDFLSYLEKKGRGFTPDDKHRLIDKHMEIMARIFTAFKDAAGRKTVEISTSPFYHPILPLLIDNTIARKSDHSTTLPSLKFRYPEDAGSQIKNAIDFMSEKFGVSPVGMWPSEGSVSEAALMQMAEFGIKWAATDERVLLNSLNMHGRRYSSLPASALYRPYLFEQDGKTINLFFRDHKLSDNIGFVYSHWAPEEAAKHFLRSLNDIRDHLQSVEPRDDYIVSVILDGENAWEFYQDDGNSFLETLYGNIEKDPNIEMITYAEYLGKYNNAERLQNVFPGSWIDGNFKIWIGHSEDNAAWDFLTEARGKIEQLKESLSPEKLKQVMNSAYIAEGSDWCWWYGDEHSTEFDLEFDELFRNYIKDIYYRLNIKYPDKLDTPIVRKEKEITPDRDMRGFVSPHIDGRVTSYFEWMGACVYNLKKFGFAMHRTNIYMETLFVGFDSDNVYIRLDPEINFPKNIENFPAVIDLCFPSNNYFISGLISKDLKSDFSFKNSFNETTQLNSAFGKILEIKIPLALTNLKEKDIVSFYINIKLASSESIRFPLRGLITLPVPQKDFEEYIWQA